MNGSKIEERNAPATKPSVTGTVETNLYFQAGSKRTKKIPDWLDHFNSRDLKVLFKCSVAAWVYTLFLLIEPTLRVIGQATFFGVLVLFIVPPSGVVFIGLLAGFSIILGACLGWAWGTITMKVALATRPAADLQRQYQHLQQTNIRNTTNVQAASGQSTFQQVAIYNGGMLDVRVSVTYFCMICLFIYLTARLRVAAPKLTLIQMFSMIISDIYLTIAPLIPTFQGTIPRTLILPAGIAVGVALVCNILIFPRSTAHLVLDGMQDVLKPMHVFLEACLLNFQNPDQHMELGRLKATKTRSVQAFKAVEANFGFLALDASVGRWGTDDVKSLHDPLRRVLVMFVSLLQLQISRREFKLRDDKLENFADFVNPLESKSVDAGHQHLAKVYDYRQQSKHPDSEGLLRQSLKALAASGDDLILVCQEALAAINQSFRLSNTKRWFGRVSVKQCEEIAAKHTAILETLRQHKEAFAGRASVDLWQTHKHMFDEEGKLLPSDTGHTQPLGGIMLSMVLEERLYYFANALELLLTRLVELERTRTKVRLWLPGNLQELLPWALDTSVSANDMSGKSASLTSTTDDDEIVNLKLSESRVEKPKSQQKKEKKKGKKDKKAVDPNSATLQLEKMQVRGVKRRKPMSNFILGTAHWFSSTEGMYALRILIVTIGLGVPAVIPASAGFYYQEKGLWALIMAQTAMLPYAADFIASFIMRMAGTVVGACLGLAMWYIGAGNGPGNPYGMAAIAVPFVIVFMWIRLFTNPALMQGTLLMVVTCYLVMAYSWVDTHIPSYGNPGVGVSVFWRRMLLVIVGFAAAAIVTFFPRPPSASKHQRRLLAESLQTVKNQYALFMLNMTNRAPDLREVSEKTAVDASDILLELEPQTKLLKLEFTTSNFDADTLGLICHICLTLNQTVTQLLVYATELPEAEKERFLKRTGAIDELLVADIMVVLSIMQQTLKTGDPLPAILPTPLMIRSMEGARLRCREDEHIITMSQAKLADGNTRRYCSAIAAFVQFLSSIDEIVLITKKAVGETTYVDVEGSGMVTTNRN